MWEKELELCKKLAVDAGKEILKVYYDKELNVFYKKDNSPLTIADQLANKVIIEGLRQYFPEYAILSEEENDNMKRLANRYCFIVDPLDGTKEFIKKNGQFTVNIALCVDHISVMGVIYAPVDEELYFATKGNGAYLEDANGVRQIVVSDRVDEIRCVGSSSHGCDDFDRLLQNKKIKTVIKMGSSLKGCLIARGDAEVYYRYNPTMEWDTAAMQCIVEEAGAVFRQIDGTQMKYNRSNSINKGFYILNKLENKID